METSFPRGRRRRSSEDEQDTSKRSSSKSTKKSKKDVVQQKKRDAGDFLFGAGSNKEEKEDNRSSPSKRHKKETLDVLEQHEKDQQRNSLLPLGGGGVSQSKKSGGRLIESLGFSKLSPGFQLLSVVREVHEDLAVFSLPNHWTGFMLRSSSWACDDMLQVGQILSVTIVKAVQETTKTGPRRRIQVSCLPNKVNTTFSNGEQPEKGTLIRGQIKTVEDHGLLIDLGFSQRGFLSFDDIEGKYFLLDDEEDDDQTKENLSREKAEHLLGEGRVLDFIVKSSPSKGQQGLNTIMKLGLQSRETRSAQITLPDQLPKLHSLQPGILVHTSVEALAKNGLCVAFANGAYRGSIEGPHLGSFFPATGRQESAAWRDVFDKNRSVTARIIAVDVATKIVRLSLMDHLLHLCDPPKRPEIGTVFEDAIVLRCDPGVGALFALPEPLPEEEARNLGKVHPPASKLVEYVDGQKIQVAYVHISKAMDGYEGGKDKNMEAAFAKDFAPSTKHTVRILASSNLIEGFSSAAAAPSVVKAHVFNHSDLVPGKIFKQIPVCDHLDSGGIRVDFGLGIKGLIPSLQLFDQASTSEYRARVQKIKYAMNAKVDVRVVKVDVAAKKCILTAKKTLVNAKQVWTSFSELTIGQLGTGFVSKVSSRGLHVSFFNDVFGLVPTRNLRQQALEGTYSVGDVIQCRVLYINAKGNKESAWDLTLAVATDASEDVVDMDVEKVNQVLAIPAGKVLAKGCLRVVEMKQSRKKAGGAVIPGSAIVEVATKQVVDKYDETTMPRSIECRIPFDQLVDSYESECLDSAVALDSVATERFAVGKTVQSEAIVLVDPKKTIAEHRNGTGRSVSLSLRQKFIEASRNEKSDLLLPKRGDHLYAGAIIQGYVYNLDPRHGAFIQCLDGLSGLVPKSEEGLNLRLFDTVKLRIASTDDSTTPPKLILSTKLTGKLTPKISNRKEEGIPPIGKIFDKVEVVKVTARCARVRILDNDFTPNSRVQFQIHCSVVPESEGTSQSCNNLHSSHPLSKWGPGLQVSGLQVLSVNPTGKFAVVDLCPPSEAQHAQSASFEKGEKVNGFVSTISKDGSGLWVEVSPSLSGFVSAVDASENQSVIEDLKSHFSPGQTISGYVLGRRKRGNGRNDYLTMTLLGAEHQAAFSVGAVVLGRVNRKKNAPHPPSLVLDLPGKLSGRCCITELADSQEWTNFPLGNPLKWGSSDIKDVQDDPDEDAASSDSEDDDEDEKEQTNVSSDWGLYPHGKVVKCCILKPGKNFYEVSCRSSRLKGDLSDDSSPNLGDKVTAYVDNTNGKGCFLRLSRQSEGRVMIKELMDGFVPTPASSFPPGRLVLGKIKGANSVHKSKTGANLFDVDLRESAIGQDTKVTYDKLKVGDKYMGTITRIEEYGAFVRLEGSDVSGLVHKSECSENFIANVSAVYDPGDLVKVLVIRKSEEKKQLSLSMKASHFANDDSTDESESDSDEESKDGMDVEEEKSDKMDIEMDSKAADDDENDSDSKNDSDGDEESSSDDDSSSDEEENKDESGLDTNVGFDWSGGAASQEGDQPKKAEDADSSSDDDSSDESDSDDDQSNDGGKTSHSSKRTQVARRKEELATSQRETALADGTADQNPETSADFERLLASNPNSSELWIRYMAFQLSLADIGAARKVATKAFSRIEFREERDKMNVWCALLTIEVKYGSEESVDETLSRACQQVNPKHIHLRLCEILEKEGSLGSFEKADDLFKKMCNRFRSKKKVWHAYLKFLFARDRLSDGVDLSKRALKSLPKHKRVFLMSHFGQLLYKYGSVEKARAVFEAMLRDHPKRTDLLTVFIDQEVKHGEMQYVRQICGRVVDTSNPDRLMTLNEKRMKNFFKRWYDVEEKHGSEQDCEAVKAAAKRYVDSTAS